MKNATDITADNRPVCQNCHHCRPMSGANVKACHWSLDNNACKPFNPELHSCEGFKVKGEPVKSEMLYTTDEEKIRIKEEWLRIAECSRQVNRLTGWARQQGVKR